jgi:alpha-galactosidase
MCGRTIASFLLLICAAFAVTANGTIEIRRTKDFAVTALDEAAWRTAKAVTIDKYWSGARAPEGRRLETRLLWSDTALYVRFEAVQNERLVVTDKPDVSKKVIGLWNRDVCEIFIAPERANPNKYFEFEIAPTGEWIDLGIEATPRERLTDWEYKSGMTTAALMEMHKVVMAIKIPFSGLGKTPKPGDVWLGNVFRCVGKDPTRGYLAWQPTRTETPNFHVPAAFGRFEFAP